MAFVLAFLCLCLFCLFENILDGNEQDVLPVAKQAVDKGWLAHDWTLNLPSGYRLLFNIFFGFLASFLTLPAVSIVGRLMLFALFGLLFKEYARLFEMKLYALVPFLFLYLRYDHITAGEWILGGLETKPFSYLFVFFSIVFLLERKYFRFFFFLGLALSFHILIGTFASLCMFGAMALNYRFFKNDRSLMLRNSYIFLVSSSFGLFAAIQNFILSRSLGSSSIGDIVVGIRAPAIASPIFWQGKWLLKLLLTTGFLLAAAILSKRKEMKYVSTFALSSLAYFVTGLAAFYAGKNHLLKFFWFRFPDVILPFFSFFIFFVFIGSANSYLSLNQERISLLLSKIRQPIKIGLTLATSIILLSGGIRSAQSISRIIRDPDYFYIDSNLERDLRDTLIWIRGNTPRESVFLASPLIDKFRTGAERAEFVSFKLYPVVERYIPEWYKRITLCNNEQNLQPFSSELDDTINRNFYNLDEDLIKRLAQEYRLDYYLGKIEKRYSLPRVFENKTYILYSLSSTY